MSRLRGEETQPFLLRDILPLFCLSATHVSIRTQHHSLDLMTSYQNWYEDFLFSGVNSPPYFSIHGGEVDLDTF